MTVQRPSHAVPIASKPGAGPQNQAGSGSAERTWPQVLGWVLFVAVIYPAYLLVEANPQLGLQLAIGAALVNLGCRWIESRGESVVFEVASAIAASACLWLIYAWFHWSPLGVEFWAPSRPGIESLMVNAAAAITTFLAAVATAALFAGAGMAILAMLLWVAHKIRSKTNTA